MSHRHIALLTLAFGVLLTALVGTSRADDSEIFYSSASNAVGPNVMFIVDTSGSMSQTIAGSTYNTSSTYSGSCGKGTVYFLPEGTDPTTYNCSESTDVTSTSFDCTVGNTSLNSLGFYNDSFIQYQYVTGTSGNQNWTAALGGGSSFTADNVACAGDYPSSSSTAGSGNGYPASNNSASGYNPSNSEWTKTSTGQIVFWNNQGSTGSAYTAYLGNYLNYRQSSASASTYNPATNYIAANPGAGCSATIVYFYASNGIPNTALGCADPKIEYQISNNPSSTSTANFWCTSGLAELNTDGSYGDSFAEYYKVGGTNQWNNAFQKGAGINDDVACLNDFLITSVTNPGSDGAVSEGYPNKSTASEWTASISNAWWSGNSTGNSGTALVAYTGNYLAYLYGSNKGVTRVSKMAVAVSALEALIPVLPQSWNVGLMTYNYVSQPNSNGSGPGNAGNGKDNNGNTVTCGAYGEASGLGQGFGGCVVLPFMPLSVPGNIDTLVNAVSLFTATGDTPLVGTLYESYLYMQGLKDYYGVYADNTVSGSYYTFANDATSNATQTAYTNPVLAANVTCQKNFVIYLTDGLPNEKPSYVDTLIKTNLYPSTPAGSVCTDASYLPSTSCEGAGGSAINGGTCLSALTSYMAHDATNSTQTYVLAFGQDPCLIAGFNYLVHAATAGGGQAFQVENADALTTAMNTITANVLAITTSFTAPTVAVNSFNRTQTLNDLFITMFEPSIDYHWPGNLKHYTLSTSGSTSGEIIDANGNPAVSGGFIAGNASSAYAGQPGTDADGNSTTSGPPEQPDGSNATLGGSADLLPCWQERYVFTYVNSSTAYTSPIALGTVPSTQVAGSPVTCPTSGSTPSTSTNQTYLSTGNTLLTKTVVGIPTTDTTTTLANVVDFALGADIYNSMQKNVTNSNGSITYGTRLTMGDSLHGQPGYVFYGSASNPSDTSISNAYVYTTDNDGFLHAINAYTGQEAWAFVPQEMLSSMYNLYLDAQYEAPGPSKHYTLDGSVQVLKFDVNGDGVIESSQGDRVILYFSSGRGGSNYYALDVTNPLAPEFMWSIGPSQLPGVGNTWSTPVIARVNTGLSAQVSNQKFVLLFGGGYDPTEDTAFNTAGDSVGHSLYMVDAVSGALLWQAIPSGTTTAASHTTVSKMLWSIPSNLTVLDTNGDGYADRIYVGDMAAQLWRFDITNYTSTTPFAVNGAVMASLGAALEGSSPVATDLRRFYNAPDVALIQNTGQNLFFDLAIGSGYRGHPLNTSIVDRMYSIRDFNPLTPLTSTQYTAMKPIVDATLASPPTGSSALTDITSAANSEVYGSTSNPAPVVAAAGAGWQYDLCPASGCTTPVGEKVLSEASIFDNQVIFTTYTPAAAPTTASCVVNVGVNNLYALNVTNGGQVAELQTTGETTGVTHYALQQTGIAPTLDFLFPGTTSSGSSGGSSSGGSSGGSSSGGSSSGPTPNVPMTCTAGVEVLNICKSFNSRIKTYWIEQDSK
jgi:type IV pilus assembly protein PilY1